MGIQKPGSMGLSCVLDNLPYLKKQRWSELRWGNCLASVQSFDNKHASDIVEIRACCKNLITPLSIKFSSLLVTICYFGLVCFLNLTKYSFEICSLKDTELEMQAKHIVTLGHHFFCFTGSCNEGSCKHGTG